MSRAIPRIEDGVKCGCVERDGHWVEFCAKHKAEQDEWHTRVGADYRRDQDQKQQESKS